MSDGYYTCSLVVAIASPCVYSFYCDGKALSYADYKTRPHFRRVFATIRRNNEILAFNVKRIFKSAN